jgi:hypothetical protein
MLASKLAKKLNYFAIDSMRIMLWSPTPIAETVTTLLFVASKPLVPDSSTDSVSSTELRHRESVACCIADESNSLFHR